MEIRLYQRITKQALLVLEEVSTDKTFFAVLSIAAFTIMVGISNNGMALSSSSSLFTVSKDIHRVHQVFAILPSNHSSVNQTK
jgi:hypothetical protein